MDNKDFWKVYYEHLEMVAGLAGKSLLLMFHIVSSHISVQGFPLWGFETFDKNIVEPSDLFRIYKSDKSELPICLL